MSSGLGPEERAVVDEALADIRAEPPVGRGPVGCLIALPGFLILLVFPVVARMLGLPGWSSTVMISIGIGFVAVGLILWFNASGVHMAHATAAAESAIRALESWTPEQGGREEALRAATLLLMNAHVIRGLTRGESFTDQVSRERLPHMMPLVLEVEAYLLQQEAMHPVFSEGGDTDGRSDS